MKEYNLYIDESGGSNINDYRSDTFILTGLVLEAGTDRGFSEYFKLMKKSLKMDATQNFHAYHFYEEMKGKKKHAVSNDKAKEFSKLAESIIKIISIRVFSYSLSKKLLRKILKFPNGYTFKGASTEMKSTKDVAYEILARKIFFDFANFLDKEKANGFIIAESRRSADFSLLRGFLDSKEPNNFNQKARIKISAERFNARVVSFCMQSKNSATVGLEIADLISYVFYKESQKDLSKIKGRGIELVYKQLIKKLKRPKAVSREMLISIGGDRIRKARELFQKVSSAR